jgi:hypothetical protein
VSAGICLYPDQRIRIASVKFIGRIPWEDVLDWSGAVLALK